MVSYSAAITMLLGGSLSLRELNTAPAPDSTSSDGLEGTSPPLSLLDLPYDVLAIILENLPPYEIPRLRRVSKAFNQFLSLDHVLSPLLRYHFQYHVKSSLLGKGHNIQPVNVAEIAAASSSSSESTEETPESLYTTTATSTAVTPSTPSKPTTYFDAALKRFFNRTKGKPTSITCINDVRPDASYDTETSYDHMFLVLHHNSGNVLIYDSGNRFPGNPFVMLSVRSLGAPWSKITGIPRQLRQSVVLDKRILVVSGVQPFDYDTERRYPQAIYSLHDYPTIKFLGIWKGVTFGEQMNCVCANDEWIGCRINRSVIKLIRIDSLKPNQHTNADGELKHAASPDTQEITITRPPKGIIKDVHLTKTHVFAYTMMTENEDRKSYIDVWKIQEVLQDSSTNGRSFEAVHIRSVLLHNWYGMFLDYIGVNSESIPRGLRCTRWDKIYPYMKGNRHDGMPEEDDNSIVMTLGKTFRANGNVPMGCVRVFAEPKNGVVNPGNPELETIAADNIIPFCIALEKSIQDEQAELSLLVPHSEVPGEQGDTDDDGDPNPFDPDVGGAPDGAHARAGVNQDPQPGDDAYLTYFNAGLIRDEPEQKPEPKLKNPSIKDMWFLEQDQTQRSSIITEHGLYHIFYDEPQASAAALNLVTSTTAENGQTVKEPLRLNPSHLQHIPLEDLFDESIPYYEVPGPEEDEDGDIDLIDQPTHKERLQGLIDCIKLGWSCYVWSADTWNGFLVAGDREAKMVILRYD